MFHLHLSIFFIDITIMARKKWWIGWMESKRRNIWFTMFRKEM